ncbi:MAG: hypothetical protein U0270_05990 [Labilithrix sp.]
MKRSTGLLVLALCMFAGRAAADEATAVKLSEEASSAFEKKDYRTAAAKFEAAYKEAPRGAVLFNAGLSWDAAGDHPRAADDLAQALARADLRPQEAAQAQKRLEELRAQLGVLDVRAPAGAKLRVEHVSDGVVPRRVFVTPGSHKIEVTNERGSGISTVTVEAGKEAPVSIEIAATSPSASSALSGPAKPAERPVDKPSDGSTQRLVGIILAGVGVASAGAAVGLGFAALSARDDYNATNNTDRELYDKAKNLRLFTNVAWITAGVLVAGGAALYLTAGPSGAAVAGRF